ncbi:sensor histidine kinase [Streptomyces sp. NPDC001443]
MLFDQLRRADHVGDAAKTTYALVPGVPEFQKERELTVMVLSGHGSTVALKAQRARTDTVLAAFRGADSASASDGSAQYRAQLAEVREELDALAAERTAVDHEETDRQHASGVYSAVIVSVLNLFGTLSTDDGSGATAAEAAHALSFLRAVEALAEERVVLDGAAATRRLSSEEGATLAAAAAVRQTGLTDQVLPYLPTAMKTALEEVMRGQEWSQMQAFEEALSAADAGGTDTIRLPAVAAARAAAPGKVFDAVQDVENEYLALVTDNSTDRNHELSVRVTAGIALATVAVLLVALMSWRITSSLLGRMSGLRGATLDLAQKRLPELVARLRTDDRSASADDLPELDFGDDELGRVAEAFNSAQRTAVNVALEQAALREGARSVFLNMSRRIQILVHRQITIIDAMEHKEQDPQLLADLYRVDHLATRMRRNAESLAVLSGSAPRRRWRQAVALSDLLRSAVSEVEGYTRVVVEPTPSIAVVGSAVGDTIHLLAELIENGVTFSPPHTEVRVRVLPVAQGHAVEVEDRGLGLSEEEYESANELLHNPQEFSITTMGEDPRLGLFTVGHLAHRHGITASLQASSYGGSMAVVVLPHTLTEPAEVDLPPLQDSREARHLASVASAPLDGAEGSGPTAAVAASADGTPPQPRNLSSAGFTAPYSGFPPPADSGREVGIRPVAPEAAGRPAAPRPESRGPRPAGVSRLPRRVRQTHLAPQLRERYEADQEPDSAAEERRPEQARSMLAALRDGTRRARAEQEVPQPTWPEQGQPRRPLPSRTRTTRNTTL